LEIAATRKKISRAEIAAHTGLSLMTVGKAADALLEMGAAVQSRGERAAAGRKAGLIELNPARFCVVFDLRGSRFRAYIINPQLEITSHIAYIVDKNYYYDENICMFLKNAGSFFKIELNMSECFGVGAVLSAEGEKVFKNGPPGPGYPDIKRTFAEAMPSGPDSTFFCTGVGGASAFFEGTKKRAFYFMPGSYSDCAFIDGGSVIFSADFNGVITCGGKKLGGGDISASDLAVLLHNISQIFAPDEIIMEPPFENAAGKLAEELKTSLHELGCRTPLIYKPESPLSVTGAARKLRTAWFDRLISN